EFARNHGVPMHVRSTFSDSEGTWIREDGSMEDAIISGITHTIDEAYVTLTDVPDKPGTAASIFNAVAEAHINVDTIIQNAVTHGDADVTFSIPSDEPPVPSAVRGAVVGATGAVGPEVLSILEERAFPASEIVPFASARSAGTKVRYAGEELEVRELTDDALAGFDLALFSAGGKTSKRYAPEAVRRGCVVVDKSSAFRMDPTVPLVVPEVNGEAADWH